MICKSIRKGNYNRIRQAGDVFSFKGDKCPNWCIEMAEGKPKTSSTSVKAVDAVKLIDTMKDIDEIRRFTEGDKRVSVIESVMERIAFIEQ